MGAEEQVKNRRAIEALRNGVPNRDAVRALGCDQPEIEGLFRWQLQDAAGSVAENGKNGGMIVAGEFGSGKSHLLEYLRHITLEENFVCSRIVISKETPLFDPVKLYRAAVEAAVVPGKRGSAMTEIAAALRRDRDAYADLYRWAHHEAGLNARFAATLFLFERMANDPELSNRIIRFWSGDKIGSGEIKRYLRACRESVTYRIDNIAAKDMALQAFQFAPRLMKAAGYEGWVLLIDEAELIGRYSLKQRAKSYAELARWTGKLEEARFPGLTAVVAITEDFQSKIIDCNKDMEKIAVRPRAKNPEADLLLASQAERGMRAIQNDFVRLKAPDRIALDKTYEKVRSIHALAYDWAPPPVESVERLLTTRMRQYVKGWITEWDLKRLDADYIPELEVEALEQDYTEDRNLEGEAEQNGSAADTEAGS
jgi:hypothetical protein